MCVYPPRAAGGSVHAAYGKARESEQVSSRAGGGWPVRPADPVHWYLERIGRVPLVSPAEETALARDIEVGLFAASKLATQAAAGDDGRLRADLDALARRGQAAKQRLIEANLRLVIAIAKRYLGRGMALADVIQEGNLGLIHAVEKFDYRAGARFSTYAGWWIRQAITAALAECGQAIRVPHRQAARMDSCADISGRLAAELGREPTPTEVGAHAGLSAHRVTALQRIAYETRHLVSLHAPVGATADGDAHELGELVEDTDATDPPEAAAAHLASAQLERMLTTLPDNYRRIVALRYGLADGRPHPLHEIALEFGITTERVRQLLTKALTRLREHPQARRVDAYPDR